MKLRDYFIIANRDSLSDIEQKSIDELKGFICDHFEELGATYDDEQRGICKMPLEAPMFCIKEENPGMPLDMIYITSTQFTYWCQVIYQLSHELTHCFIHTNNKSPSRKALWIEESICEMMAYYFLKYFAEHWEQCGLGIIDSDYRKRILEYLTKELSSDKTGRLSNCKNYKELLEIDETSQRSREDRRAEVIYVFENITAKDVLGLIKYKDYIIDDRKILDSEKYAAEYPQNMAVRYLCDLQNRILGVKV